MNLVTTLTFSPRAKPARRKLHRIHRKREDGMFQAVQNGRGKAAPVTVYWRPGCPFCSRLRGDLRAMGLAPREVNIWADPSAAATVRSLAGGNETVPTVVIGERGYVNPTAAEVLAEVRRAVPGFAADEDVMRAARRQRRLRAVQWLIIGALVAAGFALEGTGHAALSWAADGAAVAVYLLFRLMRACDPLLLNFYNIVEAGGTSTRMSEA